MNNPKFQIFKSPQNDEYYFRLLAKNGENILSSEGYKAKPSCINGIESVKINAPKDERYNRKEAANNYTFSLRAGNNEIIGRSENYTTKFARESGIESVKRDAPTAPTEDLSV